MLIYGSITKIESFATSKSPAVFKVMNINDQKNYRIKYLGFLPIQECDSIKGQIDEEMNLKNKPLVVPVETFDYLKQSLFKCLRGSKFGSKKFDDFYNELITEYESVPNIYSKLNQWAGEDNFRSFESEILSKTQMKKFLAWWKKNYLMRRLYLLGLNNKEITYSFTKLNELYEKLKSNPFMVHSITLEKSQEINSLLEKENKKNDIIGGKITRFIYQSNWTATPLSYVAKAFPEIYTCLDYIKENFPLVFEDKYVYSRYCYDMETALANKILTLLIRTQDDQLRSLGLPKAINQVQVDDDIQLTEEQMEALEGCLSNHISVVTGGAGCGKTTLIKQIVKNLIYRKEKFVLTSFTGKAVLRMKEIMDEDLKSKCFTLSLLIKKKKFNLSPPKFDILIVDEASMISGALFYEFLECYKHNFKIIFVGDANQLPPIGICDFFKETIKSGKVQTYYLTQNKRIVNNQKSSNILYNANRLIEKGRDLKEEFVYQTGKGFEIIEGKKDVCLSIINALHKRGVKMEEITVLTPYNKDIDEINSYSQNIYLKNEEVYQYGNRGFIIGDRLMQTSNVYNPDHEVMNGEEGIITGITSETLVVTFSDEKIVNYKWQDDKKYNPEENNEEESNEKEFLTCDLKHSFCKTVHKSQGSEYDYVIIYLPKGSGNFVNINLLYTAITRTKKTVWLVVDKPSLLKASNTPLGYRCDRLSERLNSM